MFTITLDAKYTKRVFFVREVKKKKILCSETAAIKCLRLCICGCYYNKVTYVVVMRNNFYTWYNSVPRNIFNNSSNCWSRLMMLQYKEKDFDTL